MQTTDTPNVRRRRVWPWLVGAPVLLVLVLVTLAVVVFWPRADSQLAKAMAVADQDDPNWRLDDLMAHREWVADEENSAIVLARVIELLPRNWPSDPPPPPGGFRPPKSAVANALDGLHATKANVRLEDSIASVLRSELKTHAEAVAIARTVADYRRGRHELVIGPTVIDTLLPETQAVRSVARLLDADAAVRAYEGDLDGALDSCRAIIGAARSIGDEPTLISTLVHIAIDSTAMSATRRVLAQGEPSDAALERIQALILDEEAQPLLLNGMKGERAMLVELVRRIEAGEVPLSAAIGTGRPTSFGERMSDRVASTLFTRGILGGQQALALEWMNESVAISRRPAMERRALWKAWDAKIVAARNSTLGKLKAMLPILLLPATFAADTAFGRVQCELGATGILIAAERQRRRTGKWPASIKDIDPKILPAAPMDPYGGGPFHLEHRDGQLIIYSIGLNGKDEHGDYDPKRAVNGGPDDAGARAWDVSLRRRPPEPAADAKK